MLRPPLVARSLSFLRITPAEGILLLTIVGLAAGMRFWGINHFVNTDENKVVVPSVQLVKGDQKPLFYPQGSYYPHLYHYVLGAAFLPYTANRPDAAFDNFYNNPFLTIGRATTAIFGTLTVLLLFFVARSVTNNTVGLLAALLLATLPVHVKYSHYAHVDVPLTFFMLLTLWAALRLWDTGTPRWYLITGLLVGLSGAVHYPGITMGAAFVLAHLRHVVRASHRLKALLRPAFLAGLLAIPLGFFLGSPYSVIDAPKVFATYERLNQRAAAGDLGYSRPDILWPLYNRSQDWGVPFTSAGLIWEVHPLLFFLAPVGIVLALMQKQWRMAVLVGVFTVILYLSISGYVRLSAVKRFLPLVPLLALLAASATTVLRNAWPPAMSKKLAVLLQVAIVVGIATANGIHVAGFDAAYARGSTHPRAAEWARQNLPPGTTILQHGPIILFPVEGSPFRIVGMNEIYANFHPEDPEVSHDRARPLDDWIKTEGVDIVYLDARMVDRYYDPTAMKQYPETTASYRAFYDDIRRRGRLLYKGTPELWKIAGPTIELYDVRHLRP